jgi:threonine dehydrogenase-like Zn-dependent dehydrogenase
MQFDIKEASMQITKGLAFDVVIDATGSSRAVYNLPYRNRKGSKLKIPP